MNSFIAIILTSLFFILSGWYLTYLLPLEERLERVGLAFLLGSGLTTWLWFLGCRLGLPLNIPTLLVSAIILVFTGYVLKERFGFVRNKTTLAKLSKTEKYLAITVVTLLILAFLIGSYNPLTVWDSLALYDFRGHAIAMNHSLKDIVDLPYYVSYPLMISLVHSIVYMIAGVSAQGIHAIIFSAFIGILYGRMQHWTNKTYALITCLLVITQSEIFTHATFAYTNLPYLVYLVSGLLYGVLGGKNKSNSQYFLIYSGLFIGLSTWIRSSEIFWILGVMLISWQGVRTKRLFTAVCSIAIIFLIRYSWSSFVISVLLAIDQPDMPRISRFTVEAFSMIIVNALSIAKYAYWNIFLPYIGMWLLTIPMLGVVIVKRNVRVLMLVCAIAMTACMTIVGIMIFSTYFRTWNQIGDSARRMILFVSPLTLIASTYSLYLMGKRGNNEV